MICKNKKILDCLLISLCFLTACDPTYPPGKLKVEKFESLSQGTSTDIKIIYPNDGGTIVHDWKEQSIEIIKGEDIIAVSGLTPL